MHNPKEIMKTIEYDVIDLNDYDDLRRCRKILHEAAATGWHLVTVDNGLAYLTRNNLGRGDCEVPPLHGDEGPAEAIPVPSERALNVEGITPQRHRYRRAICEKCGVPAACGCYAVVAVDVERAED